MRGISSPRAGDGGRLGVIRLIRGNQIELLPAPYPKGCPQRLSESEIRTTTYVTQSVVDARNDGAERCSRCRPGYARRLEEVTLSWQRARDSTLGRSGSIFDPVNVVLQ
jgi:hypothetical protein